MIEYVEHIEPDFELVSFEWKLEGLGQAEVHRVDLLSAKDVAARDVRANRRAHDVADVCRIYRIPVRIDVARW